MNAGCACNCGPGKSTRKFSSAPFSGTASHTLRKHAVQQCVDRIHTHNTINSSYLQDVRQSCTDVRIILAAVASCSCWWVMQFLPGTRKCHLRSPLSVDALYVQSVPKVTQPMAYLESVFPGRLISKRLWPPRSPDLSPPDILLWEHLKDTVYSNHPHPLQELQANIQRTVDRISTGTL
jgi:hypothetical protein